MKHLYIHSPTVIASGTVDVEFDGIYPTAEVPVTATFGDMEDIKAGMTVIFGSAAGLDDLGRQRIRKDTVSVELLLIGYSSQGKNYGEINIVSGSFFAVLDDRRVWSKNQRFYTQLVDPFVVTLKDFDRSWLTDNMDEGEFPKANAGPARAGTIDPITGKLTCTFTSANSYSIPFGMGITDVLWDIGDGTLTSGTLTSTTITVTFPAGFRYVSLRVTATNDKTHRMEIPVYARDPDNDTCVEVWQADIDRSQDGQKMTVKVFSELPRSTYPDGSVTLLFDDRNASNYVEFYGWISTDPMQLEIVKTGALRDTTLDVLDIGGMLDKIPGQTLALENKSQDIDVVVSANASIGATTILVDPLTTRIRAGEKLSIVPGNYEITVTTNESIGSTALAVAALPSALTDNQVLTYVEIPSQWGQMYHPSMYMLVWYILYYHSTACELTDLLFNTDTGSLGWLLAIMTREVQAATVFRQIQEQAHSCVPDNNIAANIRGQIIMRDDPMLASATNRIATWQTDIGLSIKRVSLTHQNFPRFQWIRGGAVLHSFVLTYPSLEVDYYIRPSAFSDITSTPVDVYPLPVDIPSGTVLPLVGADGILLYGEYAMTLTADGTAGDILLTIDPLEQPIDVWDEFKYTATEVGAGVLDTTFCMAPGLTPSQGSESLTVSNKITPSFELFRDYIGQLWARNNSEWGIMDVDLVEDTYLEDIDPALMTWILADFLPTKYIGQRGLHYFGVGLRFLPLQFTKSYSYDKTGTLGSYRIRLERETFGVPAVETTAEEG